MNKRCRDLSIREPLAEQARTPHAREARASDRGSRRRHNLKPIAAASASSPARAVTKTVCSNTLWLGKQRREQVRVRSVCTVTTRSTAPPRTRCETSTRPYSSETRVAGSSERQTASIRPTTELASQRPESAHAAAAPEASGLVQPPERSKSEPSRREHLAPHRPTESVEIGRFDRAGLRRAPFLQENPNRSAHTRSAPESDRCTRRAERRGHRRSCSWASRNRRSPASAVAEHRLRMRDSNVDAILASRRQAAAAPASWASV